MRTTKLLLSILLLAVIATQTSFLLKISPYTSDFRSFYSAAQILRVQPTKLYDYQTQVGQQQANLPKKSKSLAGQKPLPFAYPPILLILFIPLTFFSYLTAYWTAIAANVLILLTALYLLNNTIRPSNYLTISFLALSFTPIYSALHLTQSSFFSLIIFALIYQSIRNKRYFLTGLLAGFLLYKPQLTIILIPYLLMQKKPKILLGVSIGTLTVIGISQILTHGHLTDIIPLWSGFLGSSELAHITWPQRISLAGFWSQAKMIIPQIPVQLLTWITSIIVLFFTFKKLLSLSITSKSALPIGINLIIISTLLTGYHIHSHDTILLLFVLFAPTMKQWNNGTIFLIFITWLTFFLFTYSPFYPQPFILIPTITLLILWYVNYKNIPLKKQSLISAI